MHLLYPLRVAFFLTSSPLFHVEVRIHRILCLSSPKYLFFCCNTTLLRDLLCRRGFPLLITVKNLFRKTTLRMHKLFQYSDEISRLPLCLSLLLLCTSLLCECSLNLHLSFSNHPHLALKVLYSSIDDPHILNRSSKIGFNFLHIVFFNKLEFASC